ncbi:DUF7426 family protein [Subtercola endophyticus]|uniref:DUF7426 family protein n=1 Tax=Subtercola endophyticus TaxID=2895559 RepID=UPI001E3CDB2B|nr:hypothetical protein [Subtercola endophyticus]UFS59471.1 hypothetical protein LQ955_01330 [Subtercola endophyticus]
MKNYYEVADLLRLPVGDRTYTIPGLSIDGGKTVTALLAGELKDDPMSDDEFFTLMLGTAYAEMLEDGVPKGAIVLAAQASMLDFRSNRAAAELLWDEGGRPKAPEPSPASTPSPSTGKATSTRRRAGTSGTSSQKK